MIRTTSRTRKAEWFYAYGYHSIDEAEADQARFKEHVSKHLMLGSNWQDTWVPGLQSPKCINDRCNTNECSYTPVTLPETVTGMKRKLFGAANSSAQKKSRREAKQLIKFAFPSEIASIAAADDVINGGRQARERLRRAAKRLHPELSEGFKMESRVLKALSVARRRLAKSSAMVTELDAKVKKLRSALRSGYVVQKLLIPVEEQVDPVSDKWTTIDMPSADEEIARGQDVTCTPAQLIELRDKGAAVLLVISEMQATASRRAEALSTLLGRHCKEPTLDFIREAEDVHQKFARATINQSVLLVMSRNSLAIKLSKNTLNKHAKVFLQDGGFTLNCRGQHSRVPNIDKFGLRLPLKMFMKYTKGLTVETAAKWLGKQLLDLPPFYVKSERADARKIVHDGERINTSVAHAWMVKCGAIYEPTKRSYYTTNHDSDENIEYRETKLIPKYWEHETYSPLWFELSIGDGTLEYVTQAGLTGIVMHTAMMMAAGDDTFPYGPDISTEMTIDAVDKRVDTNGCHFIMAHIDNLKEAGGKGDKDDQEAFCKQRMQTAGVPGYFLWYTASSTGPDSNTPFPEDDTQEAKRRESRGYKWTCACSPAKDENPSCRCKGVRRILGQDECAVHGDIFPKRGWTIDGVRRMLPKTQGPCVMLSSFQCMETGFGGIPRNLPKNERNAAMQRGHDAVDKYLRDNDIVRPIWLPPRHDPMNIEFRPGSDKMGWWDGASFKLQTELVLAYAEAVWPKIQFVIFVDHSSGHMKRADDQLNTHFNLNWRGKIPKNGGMRSTKLTAGCVNSTPRNPECPYLLKEGDTQHFVYQPGDMPPFAVIPAPPEYDRPMTEDEKVSKKKVVQRCEKKKEEKIENHAPTAFGINITTSGDDIGAAVDVNTIDDLNNNPNDQIIVKGYVGTCKGIKQVLAERGFWDPQMKGAQSFKAKRGEEPLLPRNLIAGDFLASLPDFVAIKSDLQESVEKAGHLFLAGAKCHPETAGLGIEYSWGKMKFELRRLRQVGAGGAEAFQARLRTCTSDEVLGIERIWKFARRARRYMNVYAEMGRQRKANPEQVIECTWDMIEKYTRRMKNHRCVQEQDGKWIKHVK